MNRENITLEHGRTRTPTHSNKTRYYKYLYKNFQTHRQVFDLLTKRSENTLDVASENATRLLRTYGYHAQHRAFRMLDERTLAVKMYNENLAMSRRSIASLIAEKMNDVNALLQARKSSDKRTFVADEFFESVNELCEKKDFGSFEEVRVAMRRKAFDVRP